MEYLLHSSPAGTTPNDGEEGIMTNERDKTDSGAWTTGSGEPAAETDGPPPSGKTAHAAPPSTPEDVVGPEKSRQGTDQESNVPGRSKPASDAAESAPPNTAPGPHDH